MGVASLKRAIKLWGRQLDLLEAGRDPVVFEDSLGRQYIKATKPAPAEDDTAG